uniref:Uncharacterized protein n=1 Tax=Steinernema glaseri TaxID=37863 RepID=A0A1I7ZMA6_9BILA
ASDSYAPSWTDQR